MKISVLINVGLAVGSALLPSLLRASDVAPALAPAILGITQETVLPGKMSILIGNHGEVSRLLQSITPTRISLGLVAVSGPEEVWTFNFYSALGDMESDRLAVERIPGVKRKIEQLDEGGGPCLSRRNVQTATFLRNLSYQPDFDWAQARYLDVIVVHVRPGHHPEYLELRRMSLAGHLKGGLDGPLHVFKINTGTRGLAWMIVRPLRSLGQHDELRLKGFGEILTPEEDAKMVGLRAASMEYAEERFFRVEPGISRVPAEWARQDPAFWSPRAP